MDGGYTMEEKNSTYCIAISIGHNEKGIVCGIRNVCDISHYCNHCYKTIQNVRYNCLNCIDFDLCEYCYGRINDKKDKIHKSHTFKEIAVIEFLQTL